MFFCIEEQIFFLILLFFSQDSVSQDAKQQAAELITVRSGEPVHLTPKRLKELSPELRTDIRWTHQHLVLSLQSKTRSRDKRRVMQTNGTLTFTHVQSSDAGNYSMQVYDAEGKLKLKEDFLLTVEWAGLSQDATSVSAGGSSALISVLIVTLILLFIIMTYFFLRRRRGQMTVRTGSKEENVYMAMHGNRVNKKVDEADEKKEREEESPYVMCHTRPAVSMETPITEQKTVEEEDIYV